MAESVDILELADGLRAEAGQIIYGGGIDDLLQAYGEVFYTGSYFLDVMVWPDIDITMALDPDPYSIEAFFELGAKIARIDNVISLKFINFYMPDVPDLPDGLYWGTRLKAENRSIPWKIDLWAKGREALAEDRRAMQATQQMMDEATRKLILEIKYSLLTPEGRTPPLSGRHIYRAVLFEGLREKEGILAYLNEAGVLQPSGTKPQRNEP